MDTKNTIRALEAENLSKSYSSAPLFENVSFYLERSQIMLITGASGTGKTTLLRCLAGLERPDKGMIKIGGQIADSGTKFLRPKSRRIGMAFQDLVLWPHMTVYENVDFVSMSQEKLNKERKEWNRHLLSLFKIDHKETEYPHSLSGGEQQRVALARAFANKPEILLLDEPFSQFDDDLANAVAQNIESLIYGNNMAAIIALHNERKIFKNLALKCKLVGKQLVLMT